MKRFRRRLLDISLAIVLMLSMAAIVLGHEDPFVRTLFCSYLRCPKFTHSHAWEKMAYDLGIGSLISLLFYALIVRIPEYERRQRLKKSFLKHYDIFKKDCIAVMLEVADGTFAWGEHKALMDQEKFYQYFTEPVDNDQDRWDRFTNKLSQRPMDELIRSMEIFRDEITFILNNVDIYDQEAFEFLKRVSMIIVERREATADYDSRDRFCHFLWEVFSGWSFVTGYRKADIVKEMVKAI